MKKATFLITHGTTKDPDYIVSVEGYVFSIGLYTFGVKKTGKHWQVFELTTGLCVCDIDKRSDAVNRTSQYIDAIDKIFAGIKKGDFMDRCNEMIRKAYDFMDISFPYESLRIKTKYRNIPVSGYSCTHNSTRKDKAHREKTLHYFHSLGR